MDTKVSSKNQFVFIGVHSWLEKALTQNKNPDFDERMKTRLILILALVVLPIAIVCNFPPTAQASDEKAVRDADAEWSKAAGAKDLDKTVSFYADDALVLPPNEAAANVTQLKRLLARKEGRAEVDKIPIAAAGRGN